MKKTLPMFSRRECTIIAYMAEGYTNKQIGEKQGISEAAVQQLLQEMMEKQGFNHSFQLISWAYREGILV